MDHPGCWRIADAVCRPAAASSSEATPCRSTPPRTSWSTSSTQEGARVLGEVERALKTLNGGSEQAGESAARGLIDRTRAHVEAAQTPEMKRAVIIAGAQKLEHYSIAAWGTVKALARELEAEDLAQAMETAVEEGYRWDAEMSDLTESRVNPEALEADADAGR